jgi:Flp pilus assembly protein TadB
MHNYTRAHHRQGPATRDVSPAGRRPFAMSLTLIIVIAWLYVTVLVAANEPTVVAGIVSFLFYGALPCGLLLYFAGSKVRRQRRRFQEMMAEKARQEGEQ